MSLKIYVEIKFRFLFRDLYKYKGEWSILLTPDKFAALAVLGDALSLRVFTLNRRGVRVSVNVTGETANALALPVYEMD